MLFSFGSIPMGTSHPTGPTGQTVARKNAFAQYGVTRGKPVVHDIGEDLDVQTFDFFFSEEFCDPQAELNRLNLAFSLKTPLPLIGLARTFLGKRYVVEALDVTVTQTNRSGKVVRVEATITLLEAPTPNLFGLLTSIAKAVAPALTGSAPTNPNVRR